jgi:hypothetical protein
MPGGGDSRPDFILSNVICLSGVPDSFRDSLAEEPELAAFLDDPSVGLLKAHVIDDDGKLSVTLTNEQSESSWDNCTSQIHFLKIKQAPLTAENIRRSVQVSSVLESPIHSLHTVLKSLYTPVLLKDPTWSGKLNNKLQSVLSELDSGLAGTIRSGISADVEGTSHCRPIHCGSCLSVTARACPTPFA